VIADLDALPDDVDSLKQLVVAAFTALKNKTLEIGKRAVNPPCATDDLQRLDAVKLPLQAAALSESLWSAQVQGRS
jgi:hypothetical protein